MSFIPNKAMHHASTDEGELTDDGKVVPITTEEGTIASTGWLLGAAGAGVAVAAAAAAYFTFRSPSATKPVRRRATRSKTVRKPATATATPKRRRRTAAKKAATA